MSDQSAGRVWRALERLGPCKLYELAEDTRIGLFRVEDIILDFRRRGLVESSPDSTGVVTWRVKARE